jgi:hypothetical protein
VGHKPQRGDVEAAFARYQELTGDDTANLLRDGAYWLVDGRYKGLEGYGAGMMTLALSRFCDGWEAGRKVALEAIIGKEVPKAEFET